VTEAPAHFNHAGMSIPPPSVLARVLDHLRLEADVGGYEAAERVADELDAVPADLAALLGVDPDEVCVTESATRAFEMFVWSWALSSNLRVGDRILLDQFAYATMWSTLDRLALSIDVTVELVAATPAGVIDVDDLVARLDEDVRLVLITHVPTHVGTVTDAADVVARIRAAGSDAVVVLDVSQTLGQLDVDLRAIGCDVAFAPGRKFLRAPRGTGALAIRRPLADELAPLAVPFGVDARARSGVLALPPGARRFDMFDSGMAARLGLGEAARLASSIGMATIEAGVRRRSDDVRAVLASCAGVRLTGTPDDVGIVSFVHETVDPDEIRGRCQAAGVNVWVNMPGGAPLDAASRGGLPSVRVSPHHVTTDDDLARLAAALIT